MASSQQRIILAPLYNILASSLVQINNLNLLLSLCIEFKKKQEELLLHLTTNSKKRRIIRSRLMKMNRARKKRSCWFKVGRTDLWWQNLVSGITPKEFWKKNFRMDEHAFKELVLIVSPYISPNLTSPNSRAIHADKKVAITLYYLKDSGSLIMTANTFGVAICTTSSIIFEVCNAIEKYVAPEYLNLP